MALVPKDPEVIDIALQALHYLIILPDTGLDIPSVTRGLHCDRLARWSLNVLAARDAAVPLTIVLHRGIFTPTGETTCLEEGWLGKLNSVVGRLLICEFFLQHKVPTRCLLYRDRLTTDRLHE